MTTLTTEPAARFRVLLVPLIVLAAGIYLLFTALALEIYILVPIAAACFVIAFVPWLRLLRHR